MTYDEVTLKQRQHGVFSAEYKTEDIAYILPLPMGMFVITSDYAYPRMQILHCREALDLFITALVCEADTKH